MIEEYLRLAFAGREFIELHDTLEEIRAKEEINFHFLIFLALIKLSASVGFTLTNLHTKTLFGNPDAEGA